MNSIVIVFAAVVAVSSAGFLHAPAPLVTGYAAPAVVAHAPVAYAAGPAIVKTHHAAVYSAPAPLVTGYAHAPVAYAAGPAIVKTHGIHGGAVLL